MSLVENYAQKNRSRNQLQFFWPVWSAVAKWLQIVVSRFAIAILNILARVVSFLEIYFWDLSNGILDIPQIPKNSFAKPGKINVVV